MRRYSLRQRTKKWHALILPLATCHLLLNLAGCGFQLRGQASTVLPEELVTLRVRVIDSRVPGGSLQVELERALITQSGVRLAASDNGSAPTLNVYSEESDSRAMSVDRDVKVSEFLLRYQVVFDVTNAAGEELVSRQIITLQRDYTWDRLDVLAKEREEQELRNQMRQEAVQAIIRRLASGRR